MWRRAVVGGRRTKRQTKLAATYLAYTVQQCGRVQEDVSKMAEYPRHSEADEEEPHFPIPHVPISEECVYVSSIASRLACVSLSHPSPVPFFSATVKVTVLHMGPKHSAGWREQASKPEPDGP